MATQDDYRRIDEIETGDLVWAYNVETGELELKEVLTIYVKENKEILHLETSIGNIDTTTNHPFYVIGEGWVAAGDLEIGDEVYALDDSVSVITGYWLEVFDMPVIVYNLEVDGFHTYFVDEFGVLVHNAYHRHHSVPKYLGGDPDQKLTVVDEEIHSEIHKRINERYPTWEGKKHYDELRAADPGFDENVKKYLIEVYESLSKIHPDLAGLVDDYKNNFANRPKR